MENETIEEEVVEDEETIITTFAEEEERIRARDAHIIVSIMTTIDERHSDMTSRIKKGTKTDNAHNRGYQKALKEIFFGLEQLLEKILTKEEYGTKLPVFTDIETQPLDIEEETNE
jgi:hypothetical protein